MSGQGFLASTLPPRIPSSKRLILKGDNLPISAEEKQKLEDPKGLFLAQTRLLSCRSEANSTTKGRVEVALFDRAGGSCAGGGRLCEVCFSHRSRQQESASCAPPND